MEPTHVYLSEGISVTRPRGGSQDTPTEKHLHSSRMDKHSTLRFVEPNYRRQSCNQFNEVGIRLPLYCSPKTTGRSLASRVGRPCAASP